MDEPTAPSVWRPSARYLTWCESSGSGRFDHRHQHRLEDIYGVSDRLMVMRRGARSAIAPSPVTRRLSRGGGGLHDGARDDLRRSSY